MEKRIISKFDIENSSPVDRTFFGLSLEIL